jgi:hypothetical protein
VKVKVGVGESGRGNGKVKGGHNVLPVNLLPYLAEAYVYVFWRLLELAHLELTLMLLLSGI